MIIENANLSSLAPSSVTVENASTPLADGSVVSDGFSGALVAQIELLGNIKAGDSLPSQAQIQDTASLSSVAVLPDAKADTQDFAALLGNGLPLSYKTKDDVDHEAALAAVTDTLKYISTGATAVEKTAVVEQNVKNVMAMIVPAEQDVANVVSAPVPVRQNMTNTVVVAVPAPVPQSPTNSDTVTVSVQKNIANSSTSSASNEQNVENLIVVAAPAKQSMASVVSAEQNKKSVNIATAQIKQDTVEAVVLGADQSTKDIVMDDMAQSDSEQANDGGGKMRNEEDAQPATVKSNSESEGVGATITLPPVIQAEQVAAVNNLTPAAVVSDGATKTDGILPSFAKPLAGDGGSNQSTKILGESLQGGTLFSRMSAQDKQEFNLNYFQNSGQTEKAGQVDRQAFGLDGEKALPRVGADMLQPTRVSDNKTDVPAMTKPLSHPEWNKDLGERIVWMTNKAIPSAEIRLNPQHLGPISVRVDVTDDQATVAFTAQHAAVRETLEASIPKLREMMGTQQLNLADVSISQGSASDHGRSQSQNFAQTADGQGQGREAVVADGIDDVEQEIVNGRAVVSKGVLSIYA
ncbi:flagellar hook-length control protein FliK [Candidatus Methylobacter oryzae]|uniref:Flagellar hook-length control protein FliK n=1 Tax=Candidatus Methylobacter oryzae TaxID=2497749 RepID=A0ABY3C750_9GAMM|nr:flagellar hook-length control protein FliK [Candidatus Methylobacter oryzae]TRW90831.1 flagellar hook-length control protein FliK [Candidatus Methylobacter oryzae]